ncbi:hypothetical protein VF14_32465 [Nostoc linckia z18]|uniref:Uncharacterized protein n=2 Tax=Nostoc linckia TaxID=92942 RepID=A0A9Q6ELL9_NOSLI|nr:hypothetical protein VF02_32120 [Nostoc linckia z1]PHJ58135.1 hypothetical protein VF03_35790 [Nostoc linckia z2]PHJ62360.1 hypothetical protein VF05_26955 [Nostoc linckia z3]PHJ88500.1 hypothetical protein VF04_33330 [Nostoc linckia z7]PHJ88942.1 hypothetical protein VF07_14515 [Nostoc linckia z6]PHK02554.1 hypothetical protein VF09_31405 [Nostoc linckia z9]PHK04011.1 hypothetical protein VF08_13205 [Nostoc linckia z8]PHK15051.1 hypothetical protein VF11_29065 [Nostoc linckia z14]PHK170
MLSGSVFQTDVNLLGSKEAGEQGAGSKGENTRQKLRLRQAKERISWAGLRTHTPQRWALQEKGLFPQLRVPFPSASSVSLEINSGCHSGVKL